MVLVRLGALRFHGLIADFGSLPIDATLIGGIFDATDTVQKFVFDGSAWVEFVSGTGEDNTGANVGVGTGNVFRDKTGVTLNFKTLIGGTNIVVTDNADDITLSSTGTSPLTTKGDLFGFSTVDDRFPVGVDGQVIQADSSQALGVKYIDLLFTKGQLLTFDTGLTQLGVGTNDQVLTADSAIASGLKWADATGGGGITGLNPNSTILEFSQDLTDYTTPTSATATSGTPANAIDNDTGTFWISSAGANESITLDMGSIQNLYGLSYFINKVDFTETQFEIKAILNETVDLRSYWKFDESASPVLNKASEAGSSNPLTDADVVIVNGTFLQPGIIDDSVLFSGTGSGGTVGTSLSQYNFLHENTQSTIILWYKFTATGTNSQVILDTSNAVNGANGLFLELLRTAGADAIRFILRGSSTTLTNTQTTNNFFPDDTNFHMVAMQIDWTLSTGTVRMTVDGGVSAQVFNLAITNGVGDTAVPMQIARNNDGTSLFAGNFDEFSIFSRRLSDTEITQLYNNGNAKTIELEKIVLRTIEVADLAEGQNFIRFNGVNAQFLEIVGSSDLSLVMKANELKVQVEADPPLTTKHGQFTISGTNSDATLNSVNFDGGTPTSSVIDDPVTSTMTLVSGNDPLDPVPGAMVMWQEFLDANNDVPRSRFKIDGSFKEVRWF